MRAFRDREEAAHRLAQALRAYRGQHPLILAVPRGGVPMGRILADALDGELDVVLVRKLGAPGNPELAIGAVGEGGEVLLTEYGEALGDPSYVAAETRRQLTEIARRRARYTPSRPPADPRNRTVIVVDDGVATGATLRAALALVRQRSPRRLIVAVGVAPRESLDLLRAVADEVVCLEVPSWFLAVGEFYRDFRQVDDEEVMALLHGPSELACSPPPARAGA